MFVLPLCNLKMSCTQALMTDETISNVPILILGNKIDRPEAISEEKLREIFGLYGQTTGKVGRHAVWALTSTCSLQREVPSGSQVVCSCGFVLNV